MKWLGCLVVVLSMLLVAGVCSPANAQHCANGVCQLGGPVVLSSPVIAGPVYFEPGPVIVSPHVSPHGSPGCYPSPTCFSPPVQFACHGPQCRPTPHDWRHNYQGSRGGSVGISLNWNRHGSGRYATRWR
jgi:hypothetical protein